MWWTFVRRDASSVTNRKHPAFTLIAVALAAYVISMVVTVAVNVPLNDAIKAAGNPSVIDTRSVRSAFHARRWEVANLVRPVLTIGGFVLLAISLTVND